MIGKIVKGIAGFYYVHVPEAGIFECRAKGIFRNKNIKPLVGDDVDIVCIDETAMTGNIVDIMKRRNELIRPAVSNVDQALVIFAAASPTPNLNLLDRFLVMMVKQGMETIVCFNKKDIAAQSWMEELEEVYVRCGCRVIFTSTLTEEGIMKIRDLLRGKTTVMAGPSGVGKSSMINRLKPDANLKTNAISRKIERGRHTTRHSELFHLGGNTYIMDTPGFSSLYVLDMNKEELKDCFVEFGDYEEECRFQGCVHIHEPSCGVKNAVLEGKISRIRYDNYVLMYEELKNRKKY